VKREDVKRNDVKRDCVQENHAARITQVAGTRFMQTLLEFIAILAVVAGTAFSMLGVLGFIRMPDVYTRLHATGKVSVFGVVLLLLATVALTPLEFGKGLVLIVLLVIGGPVTSHAIGSAAHRIGIPMKRAIRDDLAAIEQTPPADRLASHDVV
jgi:multicomponent Na+:H+ antiporter subunit G